MKKVVCFVLVLVMSAALLVGCGPGKEIIDNPGSTVDQSQESTSPGTRDWIDVSVGWDPASGINDDELGKYLQDRFKIHFKIVSVNAATLPLLANTDTLPDIFHAQVGGATFNQFKEEPFIRDIPGSMLENYPKVKALIESNVYTMAYKKLSNKIWGIPQVNDASKPGKGYQVAFYYRWDWAQKLGMTKAPETLDEFYNLLKMYRENDPDGNNVKDTYGFTGWIWSMHLMPWVDYYNWTKEDGKWIPGYMSKNMLPALKWWNRLYQEKIIPGDFMTAVGKQEFMNQKVGCMQDNADYYHAWDKMVILFYGAHKDMVGTADKVTDFVRMLPPLKLDANTPARWAYQVSDTDSLISSKVDDKKLSRILEFYEFALSPEGQDLAAYGFEGKDYKVIDGKAFGTLPPSPTKAGEQMKLWEKYPSCQIFQIVSWGLGTHLKTATPTFPQFISDLVDGRQPAIDAATVIPNVAVNKVSTPARDKSIVESWDQIEADINRIIGGTNVEADFNKWINKLMTVEGFDQVIKEVNEVVKSKNLEDAGN